MSVASTVKFDILFQFRHGLYYAAAFVAVFYILLLRNLPEGIRETVSVVLLFSDTSILGFFFIGGIILLEKAQKTLSSVFVTPLSVTEYFISKTISLTLLAVIIGIFIMITVNGIPPYPVLFLSGIIFSSIFFTLIGIIVATRSQTVNGYFFRAMLYTMILVAPLADYLNLVKSPLFYLLPAQGVLLFLNGAFNGITAGLLIYAVISQIIWIGIVYLWAEKWFNKYIISKIGEN